MRTLSSLILAGLVATAPVAAQTGAPGSGGPELVDRVVAVVGDTVLLLSDLQADIAQMQASGRELPNDPVQLEALAADLLKSRVNDLILLEAATDAGLEVREAEISGQVEQDLRQVERRFGSEKAFQDALVASGMTLAEYRQNITERYRNQQLVQQFLGKRMRNRARPLVSDDQVRAAFAEQREALGTRPATVSFRQVVVRPQPTDSARAEAREEAADVLRQLNEGGDFEILARRFSDDPGSKEQGGSLGWFRRGMMVREFEDAAYAMREGETSGIVESDFGFHIIRLDRSRAGERQARHILIAPDITPDDVARARATADSLAGAVREGASITEMARQYETPAAEAEAVRVPIDRLPDAYNVALQNAAAGQVVGPLEVPGPRGSSYAVVRVDDRQEAGPYALDDIREQIRSRLQEEAMMEQLVEELRREVYVSVRQ